MKINKHFLSQIIKEEIRRVIHEDKDPEWAVPVLNYLIRITDTNKETNFSMDDSLHCRKTIKKMSGLDAGDVLHFFINKVAPKRIKLAADKLKIKIDTRKLGLTPAVYEKPSPINFSDRRSSREGPQDPREDPRTGEERKNWVHEE